MKKNKLFPLFCAIFATFCLISCKPKPAAPLTSPEFYTRTQLTVILFRAFGVPPNFGDETYQLVNPHEISTLYKNYQKDLFNKGIVRWDKKFDCNRFSLSFQSFAQISYYNNSGEAQSIAVGEIYYVRDNGGPHAINIIVTPTDFLFIEPQSGEILNLTDSEKASIDFIKF